MLNRLHLKKLQDRKKGHPDKPTLKIKPFIVVPTDKPTIYKSTSSVSSGTSFSSSRINNSPVQESTKNHERIPITIPIHVPSSSNSRRESFRVRPSLDRYSLNRATLESVPVVIGQKRRLEEIIGQDNVMDVDTDLQRIRSPTIHDQSQLEGSTLRLTISESIISRREDSTISDNRTRRSITPQHQRYPSPQSSHHSPVVSPSHTLSPSRSLSRQRSITPVNLEPEAHTMLSEIDSTQKKDSITTKETENVGDAIISEEGSSTENDNPIEEIINQTDVDYNQIQNSTREETPSIQPDTNSHDNQVVEETTHENEGHENPFDIDVDEDIDYNDYNVQEDVHLGDITNEEILSKGREIAISLEPKVTRLVSSKLGNYHVDSLHQLTTQAVRSIRGTNSDPYARSVIEDYITKLKENYDKCHVDYNEYLKITTSLEKLEKMANKTRFEDAAIERERLQIQRTLEKSNKEISTLDEKIEKLQDLNDFWGTVKSLVNPK